MYYLFITVAINYLLFVCYLALINNIYCKYELRFLSLIESLNDSNDNNNNNNNNNSNKNNK